MGLERGAVADGHPLEKPTSVVDIGMLISKAGPTMIKVLYQYFKELFKESSCCTRNAIMYLSWEILTVHV